VASQLGVAGTLIGAAVASIVSTVCAAYYTSIVTKTHQRVRGLGGVTRPARVPPNPNPNPNPNPSRARQWWLGAVAAFVLAVAGITALELGLGHPVSVTEKSGTSVGTVVNPAPRQADPTTPATSPAATPGATASPATTPTTGAPTSSPGATAGHTGSPAPGAATAPPAPPTAPPTKPVTAPAEPPRAS